LLNFLYEKYQNRRPQKRPRYNPSRILGLDRWNHTCDHFCVYSDKAPSKGWIWENGR
jgi:hypothetical protein